MCLLTKIQDYSSFFIEGIEKLSLMIGSGISFFSSPICFSVATTSLSTVVIFTKLIPCRHKESNHADDKNYHHTPIQIAYLKDTQKEQQSNDK